MPELPEVETTRLGIEPHIINQKIVQVIVRERRLRWTIPDELDVLASEQHIKQVKRRAKYLLIELESGTIIIHLGMSGSLRVVEQTANCQKHDHVDILLANGLALRYHDPRRFGCILWTNDPVTHDLLTHLGPEPLTEEFNADYLFQLSRNRSIAAKLFIMDNKVVVGVGNIYANEALFAAGINPNKPANSISKARYAKLVRCIKEILARAIEVGGTTLRDFVGGDGKPGYFQQTLNAYGRGGLPCNKCGRILKETKLGQRATVWCSYCQR
ncbi:bifunctional DNA-formamidopyrimidine glycosylase/DNA-(apurinic or apyrimidinic site) lyase [Entomomonas asaccharolytica]|uniref:Formamidopyrimidine-DNA glycosylase n=1 Tax=Entomomonas asaccharolytica TaxID=2785331 RepID=A0A974ND23_9GAMM|nr:bifunctional DNA-formamidopyrimidine glycosylase/DNA-(apurinic or apyrimidinic site) lyase [Entomomonas asaccharolytica]QQP84374.1 bifunctional DNA-formamidopyrimidine glycosylase/DNA-(apurinic or apyrimidinic site) lyase [Entomomonas asaccharolytica]